VALAVLLTACAPETPTDPPDPGAAAAGPARAHFAPKIPVGAPTVAVLGDSVAAGLHLARDEAFPAALQRRLAARGLPFKLIDAAVSGSTTAAGLARLDWILDQKPAVVVVELGANDGFRGVPLASIEENLRAIVRRAKERGAKVLLAGVRLPPNYGDEYARGFDALYARVAKDEDVPLAPYFMEGVAGVESMNLADAIHPTPEGHERLAANLEEAVARLLR
jgi:acyl-CoA thioesterase-1